MSRLPPVEKFSLAVRKNIRDEWENKKGEYEQRLSGLLDAPWKIDINLHQVCAYAQDGYAKESPGSMIASYIDGVLYQLDRFIGKHGEEGKTELNTIASARTISMDLDEDKKFSYCGCKISPAGQLVILFREGYLGTNIDYACSLENLEGALNEAPSAAVTSHRPMSFVARAAIRSDWDTEVESIKAKLSKILKKDIAVVPHFEQAFDKLSAAKDAPDVWERILGMYLKMYYEGLINYLEYQKFGEDDMLYEAFNEGVDKSTVVFRIVDKGELKHSTYNECVIEDGTLILQAARHSRNMPVSNANALAENRAAAKRQAVTTVSVVTLIFILWPERYIIFRNLCLVPVLAWLTSLVFDLKHGALDAWDGVPAWFKRIIGADDNTSSNASGPSRRGARHPQSQATTFSDYVLMHLVDTASWIKSEAVRLWGIVGPVIGQWIHQALQLLISQTSESSSSTWAEKPAPEFTQFYGILIKSPRGPRAPPPFAPPFMMRDAPDRFVLRESKDATHLPSVLSAWDTDSRLSFCLIEKAIWDDRDLTLRNKLTTGTYWNISVQGRGYPRNAMDKAEVGRISAIEVIGLGDGQYDALKKSHKCHRLLNQDWKYTKMHWDDVDFAIILALLVLGPTAGTKCVQLYRALCKLRAEQVEGPRRGAPNIDPFLIAAATGGLAAPFVLPLMAGGLAAAVMKGRNGGMPEQRRKAYRGLMIQFPEVKVLFEEEEMAQKEESREKNMREDDDDDEWKDEGDDYYNDTLSPFDW
ncbi:hypothetical protein THAR02_10440 [Trichoderma harzianum]|uniref:Uncharacterized protein n=1 Tax=Trichoderma harzianum TaxID=5544 RepID=A0A0F9ZA16_TRIHA|nr:hypothetical protein THAR02_10440 [Trichoderma harzianum]